MSNKKLKILLAEDDANLGLLLSEYLRAEGFEVHHCRDGEAALEEYDRAAFELCLIDVMMPKMDGFELAKSIRTRNKSVPLIFITARSLKDDKLKGYEHGADDYITKPFDEEELLWKIRALLRRTHSTPAENNAAVISIGKYQFDHHNLLLAIDGSKRRITEKESEILKFLYENRNTVVKREQMLKALWGENDYFLGRSLDVFITKIRKYLKADPQLSIENVFRVGFIFNVPAPASRE